MSPHPFPATLAELDASTLSSARRLFPGFDGPDRAALARFLDVPEAALSAALPATPLKDEVGLVMVLLRVVPIERLGALFGSIAEAERRVRQLGHDRGWEAAVKSEALARTIDALAARGGESLDVKAVAEVLRELWEGAWDPRGVTRGALLGLASAAAGGPERVRSAVLAAMYAGAETSREELVSRLENHDLGPVLAALGDDGAVLDRHLAEMKLSRVHDGPHDYDVLIAARVALAGGREAALQHFRGFLAQACKKPLEKLFPPPPALIDDVAAEVLPLVLTELATLRRQNNWGLLGNVLSALILRTSAAGQAAVAGVVAQLSDDDLVGFVEATSHIQLFDPAEKARFTPALHAILRAATRGRAPKWSKRAASVLVRLGLAERRGPGLPARAFRSSRRPWA